MPYNFVLSILFILYNLLFSWCNITLRVYAYLNRLNLAGYIVFWTCIQLIHACDGSWENPTCYFNVCVRSNVCLVSLSVYAIMYRKFCNCTAYCAELRCLIAKFLKWNHALILHNRLFILIMLHLFVYYC